MGDDKGLEMVKVVKYDPTKEQALISFVGTNGKYSSIWIHRSTFQSLMGNWNKEKLGNPDLIQSALKENLKANVKRNFMEWFDNQANEIMRDQAQGK